MLVVLQIALFIFAVWFSVAMQLDGYRLDVSLGEGRVMSAIKRGFYALLMIVFASSLILMLGGDGTKNRRDVEDIEHYEPRY